MIALPRRALVYLVRAYQVAASPFPSPCKYDPSCSVYAIEALERHGALKGLWLTVRRVLRCNPFTRGGIDPVP